MKNRKLNILGKAMLSMMVLLAFACTDLEPELTDSVGGIDFDGLSTEQATATVDDMYNQIRGYIGDQANLYALSEVTTDAQLIPTRGSDWGDNGIWRQLHQHSWTPDHAFITNVWNQWNQLQLAGSRVLDGRSTPSAETAANASFLRALAMYVILDNFGQVPFRDTTLPNSANPEVFSGQAAVDFINADLDAAISGLPTSSAGSDNVRATKAAARYLKAKLLLNKHVYNGGSPEGADMASVISLVDQIDGDGYALQSGFFDIFRNTSDTETIWYINTGVGNRIFNGLHYNSTTAGGGGWNGFSTLAEYYDLFEGDPNNNRYAADGVTPIDGQEERRGGVPPGGLPFTGAAGTSDEGGFENGSNVGDGFLVGQQYALDGTALTDRQGTPLEFSREFVDGSGAPSLINNSERTGIRVMKYSPRFGGGFTNHQILFRYSDAHLMKAEAMMRSGGDPTAMVNELRTIRGATPLGSVSESDLLDERGRELFVETWRRNDLIRFGQYLRGWEFKSSTETGNTTRLLFPIPLPQILANPNITQNPGY